MSIPKARTGSLGPRSKPASSSVPESTVSVQSSFFDPDSNRTKLTVFINGDLHKQLKMAAAENGEKMRDVVEELIGRYVAEHEKRK